MKNFSNQKHNSIDEHFKRAATRSALTLFFAVALISVGFFSSVEAAAGDLDATFGSGGKVTTDIFGGFDGVVSVLVQVDGKIIAVGNADGFCAAVRYDSAGNIDTTFGDNGTAYIGFDGGIALDAALQSDGKIVIVGRGGGVDPSADFVVARLNQSGIVDATFGLGGTVLAHVTDNFDAATAVAIQTDGKIVVAGTAGGTGPAADFGVVRYDASGDLDQTFGTGGIVTTDFLGGKDSASDVKIQPDGKIVVAGSAALQTSLLALARYDASGNLDQTFGTGGLVAESYAASSSTGNALAIQTDGKIVVAGRSGTLLANSDFGIARFSAAGALDLNFGLSGVQLVDFLGNDDGAHDLELQPDGKLLIGGTIRNAAATLDLGLARLDASGNLDAAFATGGKVTADFFGFDDGGGALAIQSDGKILMGGFANNGDNTDFGLVRYNGGSPVVSAPCPRGHGFWKNNPESWAVGSLTLGNQTYTKAELLKLLSDATKTDASIILARQLIAAKLNLANGSVAAPVTATITHADSVLSGFIGKLPYRVKPSTAIGQSMVADAFILDNYNSGYLTPICVP